MASLVQSINRQDQVKNCSICYDAFNRSTRKKIACGNCESNFCRGCFKQHILYTDGKASCPGCKIVFDDSFCVENLPKKFIRGEYRNHLEQQMIDLEKSKLPQCMPYVKDYMTLIKYQDAKIKMIDYVNSQIQTKKMEIVYPKMIEFIKLCNERGCVKCYVCGEEDDGYVIIPRDLSRYIRHSDYAQILSLLPDNLKKDRFYNFTNRCKKCDGIKNGTRYYLNVGFRSDDNQVIKKFRHDQMIMAKNLASSLRRIENMYGINNTNLFDKIPELNDLLNKSFNKYNFNVIKRLLNKDIGKLERNIFNEKGSKKTGNLFKHACPKSDCKGFLSQNWVCGLCDSKVCKNCFVVINNDSKEHVCKKSDIDTVKFIKSSTKPCPNCGTGISKINGCDQMWCTICKVAFSWTRGTIEKGIIHNPHYYQWMKSQKTAIRAPNDVVCGGLVRIYEFNDKLRKILSYNTFIDVMEDKNENIIEISIFVKMIENIHRTCVEFLDVLRHIRIEMAEIDRNEEDKKFKMRLDFLANKLSEKNFKNKLYVLKNKNSRKTSLLHLLELTTTVFIENINGIYNDDNMFDIVEKMNALEEFRLYHNSIIVQNSHKYNESVYYIIGNDMQIVRDGYKKIPTKKEYEKSKNYMSKVRKFKNIYLKEEPNETFVEGVLNTLQCISS